MSKDTNTLDHNDVVGHFTARADHYDRSSRWCTATDLMSKVIECVDPQAEHTMLDVACGTGLVSRAFQNRVGRLVGLDLTPAMAAQAEATLDELVIGRAEDLPFPDATFDRTICRQGIQFMDAPQAAAEMVRVTKANGKIILIDLAAYGPEDRDEYFEILRLRNPARRNFWERGDVAKLLLQVGCRAAEVVEHVSLEDVDAWSDNGAISESRREGIRAIYRNATEPFQRLHAVASEDGDRFLDHMLFTVTIGVP